MRAHIPAEPQPDPSPEPQPSPEPMPSPEPEPWHDPGPPVKKVDLPPDSPTKGIPVENPEQPPHPLG